MSDGLLHLVAPGVRALSPYQPGKPIDELARELGIADIVKLASNENPLGPSPRAVGAMRDALADLWLYPDGGGFELKRMLAARHGVSPGHITLGNGSNDVLVLLAETFLTPAHEAVYSQYAFAAYPIAVQAAGATARVAPANPADHATMPLGHAPDAMAARFNERTRLVFIANPNNPTGTWLSSDALRGLLDRVPDTAIVVVDEAYFEYVDLPEYPDAATWLDEYPNLVVTRTFSKAFGLAGIRVGYSVSSPDIAGLLNRVRQPFNVNTLAQLGACAALEDEQHVARSREVNAQGLAQLAQMCEGLGLDHPPSVGNFLLVDLGRPARPVYEALLSRGVIVRPVANYGLANHLRITAGLAEQNVRLAESLAHVLREH